jgi:hypothetical protein
MLCLTNRQYRILKRYWPLRESCWGTSKSKNASPKRMLSMLQPYLLYFKIGGILVGVIAIAGVLWWVTSAFNERGRLRTDVAIKASQIEGYQAAMARELKLREDINEAISNIQITTNNTIKNIDGAKAPTAANGTAIQLVPSGVLPKVSPVSTFANITTNSNSTVTQAN